MEGKRTQLTYAYFNNFLHHLIFPRILLFFNQDSNHLPPEYKLYNLIKQLNVNYDKLRILVLMLVKWVTLKMIHFMLNISLNRSISEIRLNVGGWTKGWELLVNLVKRCSHWEAGSHPGSQDMPWFVWKPKTHPDVNKLISLTST